MTIFVAMDGEYELSFFTNLARSISLDNRLSQKVGFKIGYQFFYNYGTLGVNKIEECGMPIFLDLKLHDIPNTAASGLGAILKKSLGNIVITTAHLQGGAGMLSACGEELNIYNVRTNSKAILAGVALLTSLDDKYLRSVRSEIVSPTEYMLNVIDIYKDSVQGVISSPLEVRAIKQKFGTLLQVITPGVRPYGVVGNDHARSSTPLEAITNGADHLVIGRPIVSSNNPLKILHEILDTLYS